METNEEGVEREGKATRTYEVTKHQMVEGRNEWTKERYRKGKKLRKF